ncbi:hypothetical protein GVAV_000866 [Gurleya vavrai]
MQILLLNQIYSTSNTDIKSKGFKLKIESGGNNKSANVESLEFVFDSNLDDLSKQNLISTLDRINDKKNSTVSNFINMGDAHGITIKGKEKFKFDKRSIPKESQEDKEDYKMFSIKDPGSDEFYFLIIVKDIPDDKIECLNVYLGKFNKKSTDLLVENLPKKKGDFVNIIEFKKD